MAGRTRWVIFGCFICQLALGYGYVFGPLLADITGDLGLTRTAFGSARVGTTAAMALASPLFGWLVVRVGARPVLVGSSLLILVAYGWLSRIESLADLYVGYVLVGLLTTGLGDVTIGAVVSQWVVRGRGLALGIVYTGSNFAAIIFVQVSTWLAIHQSWRTALFMIGLAGAALILPFAAFVVRDRRPEDPLPAPELAVTDAPSGNGSLVSNGDDISMTGIEALRTRSFWILFFALFGFFFYFLAILDLFVVFLTDAGVDRQAAATYFSAAVGMGLVSKVAMGAFADRLAAR
ncbi:MAG: MFS transporter, partial [Myxococcota bacterium]|nr:MFS transporter [Myxococcota bacterium]